MYKSLSYEHALETIRRMYRFHGFTVEAHTLGQRIYAEFGRPVAKTHLGALYAFVDEQCALLRMVSWYFVSAIGSGGSSASVAAVFYRLTIAHMRTLASIRMLCSCGFDVNARHQVRKLYENVVLWTRLSLDPEAMVEFTAANTPGAANRFWHKYLSREKSEKFIRENATQWQWAAEWGSLVEELKTGVGPAAHPSFMTSVIDARQDFADCNDGLVVADPQRSSHLTLSHSIIWAAAPFAPRIHLPEALTTRDMLAVGSPFNCIPHPTTSWAEYSQKIQAMLPSLVLMAVRFAEKLKSGEIGDPLDS